jgi:hypothetical protein
MKIRVANSRSPGFEPNANQPHNGRGSFFGNPSTLAPCAGMPDAMEEDTMKGNEDRD